MNFRQVLPKEGDSFQIAPLIDTVFLLLTFFIATWSQAAEERETPVDLPKTSTGVLRRQEKLDIVINVTREGRILVHGREYSVEKLRRDLADIRGSSRSVSVIVRADGKSYHEDVVKVLDACASAEIRTVSFVSVNAGRTR